MLGVRGALQMFHPFLTRPHDSCISIMTPWQGTHHSSPPKLRLGSQKGIDLANFGVLLGAVVWTWKRRKLCKIPSTDHVAAMLQLPSPCNLGPHAQGCPAKHTAAQLVTHALGVIDAPLALLDRGKPRNFQAFEESNIGKY